MPQQPRPHRRPGQNRGDEAEPSRRRDHHPQAVGGLDPFRRRGPDHGDKQGDEKERDLGVERIRQKSRHAGGARRRHLGRSRGGKIPVGTRPRAQSLHADPKKIGRSGILQHGERGRPTADEQADTEQRIGDVQGDTRAHAEAGPDRGAPPVAQALAQHDGQVRAGTRHREQVGERDLQKLQPVIVVHRPKFRGRLP